MKVKKFTLNKDSDYISTYKLPDQFASDILDRYEEAKVISIYLVEIRTLNNPSDIIFQLGLKGETKDVPLSLFKTELLLINDTYCWNTANKEDFKFSINDFKIKVEGENNDFIIDFYYSTDQKRPYISLA